MHLVCGDTNPPTLCVPPPFPPQGPHPTNPWCWFSCQGREMGLHTPGSERYREEGILFALSVCGFYLILCFPDSPAPSPLQAVLCRQEGSSALLHIPAPALELVTGCCNQDTFCALPPPPSHIIWIHIIKRLAAEIAHGKIILNWFINAHLCRILKYVKNMRAKEKGSE